PVRIVYLFASLAEQFGPRAIAVILSGSGSDGSRGVRRINAQGGLVMVEDPDLAAFDGMPVAAIETAVVDCVLGAEALAPALADPASIGDAPDGDEARAIEGIITLLNERLGVDF